jgi:hypothetical protein
MVKGVQTMASRRLTSACVIAVLLGTMLVGCGGETTIQITMVGVYNGTVIGDGAGPIRFYVGPGGHLTGNLIVAPLCNQPIHVIGTVDPSGKVRFTGTGCGCTYTFRGKIERLAPGSNVFVGSGTWKGCGTRGTWSVTWVARTGSISV